MTCSGIERPWALEHAQSMEDFRLAFDNEGLGDHVVKGLLLSCERRNDEPDAEQEGGNILREVAAGCTRKRHPLARRVRHDDRHDSLTDSRLPFRTHHERFIQPRCEETKSDAYTERGSGHGSCCCDENGCIDHNGNEPLPESRVLNTCR